MDTVIRGLLRPDWESLEPYEPVKPYEVLAAEIGMAAADLVKLDANENLYGPIPEVFEAIENADLHIYPDPGQAALRGAIAEYADVTPEQVVAGQGADDLIDIVLRVVQPAAVVDNTPSFGMYRFLAKVNRARVIEVARDEAFEVDVDGVAAAVEAGAKVVFLTSPNNPTGNLLPPARLEALLGLDALIVVDEAYVEFSGGSLAGYLHGHPNLLILRTFSKWAALAGLRVGYALCHPDLAGCMMAVKQPYNVSVAAEVAARAAIAHRATIRETVRCIVAERERMTRGVAALGWLVPHPSDANFVLFDVKGRNAGDVVAALRKRGVLVRRYSHPRLRDRIRISVGRRQETDRLLRALREVGEA